MPGRPTMRSVAEHAGVSHQTVSRVLNDHPNVREQTRRRVQAAIAELGYRPNRAARVLVTGTSQVIGVVAQSSTRSGPGSVPAPSHDLKHAPPGSTMSTGDGGFSLDFAPSVRLAA